MTTFTLDTDNNITAFAAFEDALNHNIGSTEGAFSTEKELSKLSAGCGSLIQPQAVDTLLVTVLKDAEILPFQIGDELLGTVDHRGVYEDHLRIRSKRRRLPPLRRSIGR
jgi:hypothetical protein